jgi:hypothetical protein
MNRFEDWYMAQLRNDPILRAINLLAWIAVIGIAVMVAMVVLSGCTGAFPPEPPPPPHEVQEEWAGAVTLVYDNPPVQVIGKEFVIVRLKAGIVSSFFNGRGVRILASRTPPDSLIFAADVSGERFDWSLWRNGDALTGGVLTDQDGHGAAHLPLTVRI